jgi:hypothetical protein
MQIDGNDPTCGTDELSDEHRDVTHPATDVQHAHSRRNACVTKEMPLSGCQRATLPNQSQLLAIRMAEKVF